MMKKWKIEILILRWKEKDWEDFRVDLKRMLKREFFVDFFISGNRVFCYRKVKVEGVIGLIVE